jgi:iron only hydrogenase large subunit-like protein
MNEYTGASAIFGTTGRVMEAALRTAYEVATNKTLENVKFTIVRGLEGLKEPLGKKSHKLFHTHYTLRSRF